MTLCLAVSLAHGATRGAGSERSGGERSSGEWSGGQKASGRKPPGGAWSEYNPEGKQGNQRSNNAHNESGAEGAAAGHAAEKNKQPQASGAEGAAAGHAAAKNDAPQATGAQGAAAGAAVANHNAPAASGAQGAAAGYAAGKNNNPQVSGAQGAAVGAAAANQNAPAASGAEGAAAGYAAVRNSVDHPGMYGQPWYGDHQGAWSPAGWAAGAAWSPATWGAIAGHCGYGNHAPVSYNYGSNVTCVGGNVVVNGQPAGTAEEFSQEAADVAETGTNTAASATDQWLPLGVFALVRNEHQHPQLIMQLAINQHGVLRGNYTDEVTDTTLPIHGAVDEPRKRAAWTVGDNKYSVMEAGLSNLTENEVPALIHKNGTTQRWLLVRLAQPSQGGNDAAPVDAPR